MKTYVVFAHTRGKPKDKVKTSVRAENIESAFNKASTMKKITVDKVRLSK